MEAGKVTDNVIGNFKMDLILDINIQYMKLIYYQFANLKFGTIQPSLHWKHRGFQCNTNTWQKIIYLHSNK